MYLGQSKTCRRQPFKSLEGGPFLNTLSHLTKYYIHKKAFA